MMSTCIYFKQKGTHQLKVDEQKNIYYCKHIIRLGWFYYYQSKFQGKE